MVAMHHALARFLVRHLRMPQQGTIAEEPHVAIALATGQRGHHRMVELGVAFQLRFQMRIGDMLVPVLFHRR